MILRKAPASVKHLKKCFSLNPTSTFYVLLINNPITNRKMLQYILWNADPEVFSIFGRDVRWYGLFFAGSFYVAGIMLSKMLQKKGMDQTQISKLILFLVVGCIVGLRLGHCFFYEPAYYLKHPIEIFQIWKGGLASHGAAIGILLALYLYVRKSNRSYLWLLDRIVIVVLFIAPFIRAGNLMNSEIIGDKTNHSFAFLFVSDVDDELSGRNKQFIDKTVIYQNDKDTVVDGTLYSELSLEVYFNKKMPREKIRGFLHQYFVPRIDQKGDLRNNVKFFDDKPGVEIVDQGRNYKAIMTIYAFPRHPSQLYEATAYLLFFLCFLFYYMHRKGFVKEGFLFGMFLILVFGFRFFVEFLKEVQVSFENSMILNMGQILSIPLVIVGILIVIRSRKMPAT
jgi:prolipoprotein diacylglyceryltransferase